MKRTHVRNGVKAMAIMTKNRTQLIVFGVDAVMRR